MQDRQWVMGYMTHIDSAHAAVGKKVNGTKGQRRHGSQKDKTLFEIVHNYTEIDSVS
jgi:hypothetical protein